MSEEKVSLQPNKGIEYKRGEDFRELYANNTQLLASNWDLELAFGQLDLKQGPNVVVQHTSMTLPWSQVKVLIYFLQMSLYGHEADFGRIVIPKGIVGEFPAHKPKEAEGVRDEVWNQMRKMYETFIQVNPEAK